MAFFLHRRPGSSPFFTGALHCTACSGWVTDGLKARISAPCG